MNLNQDRLPEPTRKPLAKCGIKFPSRNMYHSIIARAVEIHIALLEAIRLLEHDHTSEPLQVPAQACAGS